MLNEDNNFEDLTTEELKDFYSRLKQDLRAMRRDPETDEMEIDRYTDELHAVRDALSLRAVHR